VIEGYTHEEIGSMLGIQASTSRGQLLKARKYLQNLVLKKFNTIKI
jgi:DNA-directed RNA polymerase specialized sigma24 family protein